MHPSSCWRSDQAATAVTLVRCLQEPSMLRWGENIFQGQEAARAKALRKTCLGTKNWQGDEQAWQAAPHGAASWMGNLRDFFPTQNSHILKRSQHDGMVTALSGLREPAQSLEIDSEKTLLLCSALNFQGYFHRDQGEWFSLPGLRPSSQRPCCITTNSTGM